MRQNIMFHIGYLGQYYAQHTLMDYLRASYDCETKFIKPGNPCIPWHLRSGFLPKDECPDASLNISMLNNEPETYKGPNLQIDEFLLKNCAAQYTDAQKESIRAEYGIDRSRPLLVVGWAEHYLLRDDESMADYFRSMSKYADIFFVGGFGQEELHALGIDRARAEARIGFQKRLLAVANASIYLEAAVDPISNIPMHDIIEGTANSRHFHHYTGYGVYGSEEMEKIGAMRSYMTTEETFDALKNYVMAFAENPDPELPEILSARNQHIEYTRKAFLPVVKDNIDQMLGLKKEISLHPDLIISEDKVDGQYVRRIRHRDTAYSHIFQDLSIKIDGNYPN